MHPKIGRTASTPAEADFCVLQFPTAFSTATGQPTQLIYGRIFEAGVTEAAVTLQPGVANVTYDPARTQPAALRAAIEDAGFDVVA